MVDVTRGLKCFSRQQTQWPQSEKFLGFDDVVTVPGTLPHTLFQLAGYFCCVQQKLQTTETTARGIKHYTQALFSARKYIYIYSLQNRIGCVRNGLVRFRDPALRKKVNAALERGWDRAVNGVLTSKTANSTRDRGKRVMNRSIPVGPNSKRASER